MQPYSVKDIKEAGQVILRHNQMLPDRIIEFIVHAAVEKVAQCRRYLNEAGGLVKSPCEANCSNYCGPCNRWGTCLDYLGWLKESRMQHRQQGELQRG